MESFDAVIVGGGPAGSTCAWQLRRAGLSVCVLDRAIFPRDKICAGWITPAVVDVLELDLDEYRRGRVFQPITAFRTGLIGTAEAETRYGEPVSFGIRRCEFDHYLLQRSAARLRCGEPLSDLRRIGREWIVNHNISTPLVIGAGGHFCPVARWLNESHPTGAVVATLETEVSLSDRQLALLSVQPNTPRLYFCDDLNGNGWCFLKGRFLNVGIGRQHSHGLPKHAQAFLDFLISQGAVPPDLPMRFRGHAYLLADSSPRRVTGDAVLLAGDSAGLADPHSGEGIRPAVESGVLAANAVLSANGQYDGDHLESYRHSLRARFGAFRQRATATADLPPWIVRHLARRLLTNRWFAQHVVLDRWFLGRTRPPLNASA
jgi:flavin-dependent dehydrogenase